METGRRDFLVGLFVLTTVGVVLGALGITSGIGKNQYDLYMQALSAQDLTQDTRIYLRGLAVGRVRQVNPLVDGGRLSFVARLAIDDEFPDGTPLQLPSGTHAEIGQATPISATTIELITPDDPSGEEFLQPGDTIRSERRTSAVDILGGVASELTEELLVTLQESRTLMARLSGTLSNTDSVLTRSGPRVATVLEQIASNLALTESLLGEIQPRVGPLQDSLTAALADTREAIRRFNELAVTALTMASENQEAIRETVLRLQHSAVMIEHFTDQISRRPLRLLTGVRPPQPEADTSRK